MLTPSPIKRTDRTRLFLAAVLVLRLLLSFSPAQASDVIVLKDAEIKPYRDAIQGFKSTCDCRVRELEASDNSLFETIKKERPDAVFAVGTRAFKKAVSLNAAPVIYTLVIPSETTAIVRDDVTGVSMDIDPETYLSTMTRLFPGITRIGVISDPEHTGPFVNQAEAAARARGITMIVKKISNPRQVPALLTELLNKIDVFWMLPDATLVNPETIDYLMLFSFQNKVPVFSFSKKYVETGAVAALTINPYLMGAQSGELAKLASREGKRPQRAYARNARLIVNNKVIAKLGVRISGEILRNAEQVE